MKRGQETFTQRFRKRRRLLVLVLVSALVGGLLPSSGETWISRAESAKAGSEESHGLSNPVTDSEGITTWDCVYFGNYWQNDTNGDGVADKNDEKEPIKWRVLSVDGDDAFLLSDKNLDGDKYNDTYMDVTWETCTMRSWLNGYGTEANKEGKDYSDNNFLDFAFSESEQLAIRTMNVVNDDNPYYGTEGGNDTSDKIYLLSIGEIANSLYGFASDDSEEDKGREAKNTVYTKARGVFTDTSEEYAGNGVWWLRSPGNISSHASLVRRSGYVDRSGGSIHDNIIPIRPALYLNLSSLSNWSYAGSVTSEGNVNETGVTKPTVTPGGGSEMTPPTAVPGEAIEKLKKPTIGSNAIVTWDCVYFGNYWQEDTNGDGKADKNDTKTPIKWRVLSVDGGDAFLLADKNLDCQIYQDTDTDASVTWETCTMRSWLNSYGIGTNKEGKDYSRSGFLNYAFSALEQSAIETVDVVNDSNPEYATEGGRKTSDKVYLLSIDEVTNPVYGFISSTFNTKKREAVNTAYVAGGGELKTNAMISAGNADLWWLRSPGVDSENASYVGMDGSVFVDGGVVNNFDAAVRPALHLNLKASSWTYAGTVTSEGKAEKPGITNPSVKPTPTIIPTKEPVQSEELGRPTVTPSPAPEETVKPTPSVTPTKEPVQSEKPGKPTATPSQTPGTWQTPTNPVITPGSHSETAGMPAASAVQKPGKVTGLKLKAVINGLQASWKKCKGATGYEVWYGTSKKLSNKKKKNVKSAGIAIKKLKKKKTYYVKVRAFVNRNGKKVYGAWSGIVKRKVK